MQLENKQISMDQAKAIAHELSGNGFPTKGRILILSPTGEQKTKSGIIISQTVDKKELPRKGVIIQDNTEELSLCNVVGTIVTYGMYAGKEIQLDDVLEKVGISKDDYIFTVLSYTEVIYIETNK